MRILFIITLLLFSFMGQAQKSNENKIKSADHEVVRVFMKNGAILNGKLISYNPDKDITIEITKNIVVLPIEEVKKIVMMASSKGVNISKIKRKKVFHRTNAALISNSNGNGISLNYSAIYQHSPLIGVGLGAGIDNYYFNGGHNVYPIFMEFKSFLVDGNSSPFVSLKSGYGFIFADENLGQVKTKGGMMLSPTFGYRIGSKGVMFDFYIGFRFQSAEYETYQGSTKSIQDIQWNRVETGFALSF